MKYLLPLAIVLIVLKLAGVLAIGWGVALIPIWVALAIIILMIIIAVKNA